MLVKDYDFARNNLTYMIEVDEKIPEIPGIDWTKREEFTEYKTRVTKPGILCNIVCHALVTVHTWFILAFTSNYEDRQRNDNSEHKDWIGLIGIQVWLVCEILAFFVIYWSTASRVEEEIKSANAGFATLSHQLKFLRNAYIAF